MKVTTTRILDKKPIFGQGTGKHQGYEVYPTTPTLLKRIKMSAPEQMILVSNQHKTLDKLPDYKSINNLREYQIEDVKFLAARKCAGCFNQQRTGKTPTALSVMKTKDITKLLIIKMKKV